jgi:hypothetical protein
MRGVGLHEVNRRVYGSPRIHAALVMADAERVGKSSFHKALRKR